MERVIKRFLLHKQREEQDEIREGDFEELKQDIQMLRFEMMNRLDETRDDLSRSSRLLNEGVLVVGELLSMQTREQNSALRENFREFKRNFHSNLKKFQSVESETTTVSPADENDSPTKETNDVDPVRILKEIGAVQITLSNIVEENEEVEAKNASVQTIDEQISPDKF